MCEEQMVFDSLSDVLTYVFRQEQTSMLSLDRICEVLQQPNLFLNSRSTGLVQCSTISRRRISSVLSSSDFFVRAGPLRTCLWAIRPHNPLFLSNGSISASIEQMLTSNGPLTLEQFVEFTELNGADIELFAKFLDEHKKEFSLLENGTYWFTGQEPPQRRDYENISRALVDAFSKFPQGASVEELHWYLCLSTVAGSKKISRRNVSRELSRRSDLFAHLSRARYSLVSQLSRVRARSLPTGFRIPGSFQDPNSFQGDYPQTIGTSNPCPLIEPQLGGISQHAGGFQIQPQYERINPPFVHEPEKKVQIIYPIPKLSEGSGGNSLEFDPFIQPSFQIDNDDEDEFDPLLFFENKAFGYNFD